MNRQNIASRLAAGLIGFTSLALASSCVIVQVEGEFPEDNWLTSIVHGSATPAGFDHGETEIGFVGHLFGKRGEIEMEFSCEPGEVAAYFEGICEEVEITLEEERDGHVTRVLADSPRRRVIEYDGEDGYGEVEIRVIERGEDKRFGYRLEISWKE